MQSMKIFAALLASALLLWGCSNTESAKRTNENPGCTTIAEGFFHSGTLAKFDRPAIAGPAMRVHRRAEPEILKGKIVRIDTAGIVFDPKKESPFVDADSSLFPYDKIEWAVDSTGTVIYGKLPDRKGENLIWDVELEMVNDAMPEAHHILVNLEANMPFSYCLAPGSYTVKKIVYREGAENEEVTDSVPSMRLTLAPNVINYVGDIYLDSRADSLPNVASLSTKIVRRSGYMIGMQFGLIGALVYEATKGDALVHTLAIEDTAFTPSRSREWKKALFSIDASRPVPKK